MPCIYVRHHLLLNPTPCFFPSIITLLFYINKSNRVICDILGKVIYFFQISPSALAENFQFSSFRNSFTILNFVCSFWKWKINAASLKLVLQKYECITGDVLTSCLTLSGYISVVTSLLKIYSFETTVLVYTVPRFLLKAFFSFASGQTQSEVNCVCWLYVPYCRFSGIDLSVQLFQIISNLKRILWKYGFNC